MKSSGALSLIFRIEQELSSILEICKTTRCSIAIFARRMVCFLFVFLLLASPQSLAMETTDDIDTNRPSFMFSPLVLPRGSIQLENGTLYSHFRHGGTTWDIPETQVRVGLTKSTEFEMFVPNFVLFQPVSTDKINGGTSDLGEIGLKHQFPAIKKFQTTFIAALNTPPGDKQISGTGVQPVFRIPWSYPVTGKLSIMGMQSLLLLNSGHNLQYQPDVMLNYSFTPRFGVFFEYVAFITEDIHAINIAHFGAVWKVARNHQLDTQWGFGMNKSAPAAFVGAGYSYRFDKFAW